MNSNPLDEESGNIMTGHIFNHPMLQFYNSQRAQQKKEEIDLINHKVKLFKMHKWNILKYIKMRLLQYFSDIFRQRLKVKFLIAQMTLDYVVRMLAKVFQKRVEIACREAQARFISFRIGYLFLSSRRRISEKLQIRNH